MAHGSLASDTLSSEAVQLLDKLRALPVISPVTTVLRCPRGASRRFAQIYASAFLYLHLSLQCSLEHIELFALIAYHLPLLLLYDARVQPQPEEENAEAPPSVRRVILDRLTLAEDGNWAQLVEDLIAISGAAAKRQSQAERRGLSYQRRFELACSKAVGRCYRAAADLLVQDTCPPESLETLEKVVQLFITDLTQEHMQEYLRVVSQMRGVASKHWVRITPKLVSKRLSSIRPAAQPGLSRSRNSHLSTLLQVPIGVQALIFLV